MPIFVKLLLHTTVASADSAADTDVAAASAADM